MSINKIKTIALDDDAVTSSKIGDNQVGLSELNVTDGTTGQALITDGSGALSFSTVSTDLSNYYTKTQTDSAISGVIDSAPGALDTLNELAASLADDADFAGTMTTALSGKAATGHTHTVAGITDLTSTAAELNYTTDVTSLIQAQLDLKSGTSHAHTGTYLPLTGGALSGGITVTGTVGATAVTGDGSGLTGLPAAGITEYDTWRLSSNFSGDATPIVANLSRASYDFEKIGTGMSLSNGVFTFPSTGKWIVRWQFIHGAYSANDYGVFNTKVSVDGGSSWATRSTQHSGASTAVRFSGGMTEHLVNVTSTSTVKVRFDVIQANQGNQVYSGAGANHCAMIFIRIGDT
jgi:hypothetical protein